MASKRLTQGLKQAVINAAVDHRFGDASKRLEEEHKAIGDMMYNALYDAETQAAMDTRLLPRGAFTEVDELRLRSKEGGTICLPLSRDRPVFAVHTYGAVEIDFNRCPEVLERYKTWKTADHVLSNQRHGLHQKIRALVESVNTVSRLLKVWPEAKLFLPEEESPSQLPAPSVAEINRALGL